MQNGPIHKNYSEFSVKNVWPLVSNHAGLCEYLPDDEMNEGRYPDKLFFWGICYTVIPEWSKSYTDAVWKQRNENKNADFKNPKTIHVTDKWLGILEEHDFQSRGKLYCVYLYFIARGKNTHSVLIR